MLTQLTGRVDVGDAVVVNTTAVDLGLGTGGWHVVHWNLARDQWSEPGPGHIMKARYTSLQTDVGSSEEHWTELADITSIDGMPVVAAALHSQVPAIAAAFKRGRPDLRLAYVMTDGAALPLALSDLVWQLRERSLLDATITCGHAFGGDYEAVSVYSALAVARHIVHADAAIVAMGPGIVGTASRGSASAASKSGRCSTPRSGLGGVPIACLRVSFADPRERHRGLSHHSATALTIATRSARVDPGAVRRRRAGAHPAGRARVDPGSPTGTSWSTSRRPASSSSSSRTVCTSCRWAGRRPTIPCCSKPRPPRASSPPPGSRGRPGPSTSHNLPRWLTLRRASNACSTCSR